MQLNMLDWAVIAVYFVLVVSVGLVFAGRAGRNLREFFVAGSALPWWIIGTSVVATDFNVDTALVVSSYARRGGIWENWLWWPYLFGGMMTTFFFARLWRRAGLLTDNELVELRYDGRSASVLRGFLAVYKGVVMVAVLSGFTLLAGCKVSEVFLGIDNKAAVAVTLAVVAVSYTVFSGFWGVVMTDFIQFVVAFGGSLLLAGVVLWNFGGPAGLVEQVSAAPGVTPDVFHFFPSLATVGGLAAATFAVQVLVQWWAAYFGGGYAAQRLFAARDERHAIIAVLWSCICSFALRTWPWVIVGLGSLVYFPLAGDMDPEQAYPHMILRLMPAGLRGLMVGALLAAFMSSMDTLLNWGGSYLINDLYRRFLVRNASERHYVAASRVSMVLLAACGVGLAIGSENISDIWKYTLTLSAGVGTVLIVRWFWWRVNAWSEISAMLCAMVLANADLPFRLADRAGLMPGPVLDGVLWFYSPDLYAIRLTAIAALGTGVWVAATYLTAPVAEEKLRAFYRKVHPAGAWGPIAAQCPDVRQDRFRPILLGWLSGVSCVFAAMFGLGYLLLARPWPGLVCLAASVVLGRMMFRQAMLTGVAR